MPLYTYRCAGCDSVFELLVRSSDTPVCPSCGSASLERQLSAIAPDSKSTGIIQQGRAKAAKEGHFSNYSKAERGKIK